MAGSVGGKMMLDLIGKRKRGGGGGNEWHGIICCGGGGGSLTLSPRHVGPISPLLFDLGLRSKKNKAF